MKIVFISNYFNHHQNALTENLYKKCSDFQFVSTTKMREERVKMGYNKIAIPEYVKEYGKNFKEEIDCAIRNSDVVIIGSASHKLVKNRIKATKLTFKYSERPLRKKNEWVKYIPRLIKWHMKYPHTKPVYVLCASAYTIYDFNKFFLFRDKAYKWGYFTETKYYDIKSLLVNKEKKEILWCGRFLDWKHPDDVIEVAERLKKNGYIFKLRFIGTGVLDEKLRYMVKTKQLEDCVIFEGTMPPGKVREYMERAGIYLFTSDYKEGWGAVLNESMNSGCVVVASHAIGSVPYLIKDNENGLIYESGNKQMLYEKVKVLLENPEEQERLGNAAYKTIVDTWNAEVAATRLMNLTRHILNGEKSPNLYADGPCSKAEIIKDNWFYE